MRYDDGAVLRMRNKSNTGESAPRYGEKRGRNKVCYGECENEHGMTADSEEISMGIDMDMESTQSRKRHMPLEAYPSVWPV